MAVNITQLQLLLHGETRCLTYDGDDDGCPRTGTVDSWVRH